MKNLLILDAGHNEYVLGKESPDKSLREWDFNNQMQYKLKKRAEDHGILVYLTNPSPAGKNEIGLSKRAQLANDYWSKNRKSKALFVSIHANAYGTSGPRGVETFTAKNGSTNSKNAANYINTEIYNTVKLIDKDFINRGIKAENFTVIYKANMPSILIEYAFYSNPKDLNILKNNKDDLVEATIRGICKYFGIKYIPNEISTVEDKRIFKIVTGGFGSKENAEAKAEYLRSLTGWYLEIEQFGNDYRIVTGGFTGEEKVKRKLNALVELTNWWAVYVLQ